MLNKKNLIKKVDSHLGAMIELVNIPNFTKCIAQYSGLPIKEVSDEVVETYLIKWANNKHRFFNMLGNKLQVDLPMDFQKERNGIEFEIVELSKEYPAYAPWLGYFSNQRKNKINIDVLNYESRHYISALFPNINFADYPLTRFFSQYLKAPDDLITKIGRIFEGDMVKGTWTLSIDPVDMMLASENPYDWNSCYRLDEQNMSGHQDGCLAAVLDDSSLISYIWTKSGDLGLYSYTLEHNIRYKRIRQWVSISPTMCSIHFNDLYPTKNAYGSDFKKAMRDNVEQIVADYLGAVNMWKHNEQASCYREYGYGYAEFDSYYIWTLSEELNNDNIACENWSVYNSAIKCPCGCGMTVPGSDEEDLYGVEREFEYAGGGLRCSNFVKRHWCELADCYCTSTDEPCEEDCRGCEYWDEEYPQCGLDPDHICEDQVQETCAGNCSNCSKWISLQNELNATHFNINPLNALPIEEGTGTFFIPFDEGSAV